MRIKFLVPFPLDEKGLRLREAQLPKHIIRRGFKVEFVPVKASCSLFDSYYDYTLEDFCVLEAGLNAEAEGYDAVCIDTVSDSGMNALRSRLKIPVVGPANACYNLAGILGHKFSILTYEDKFAPLYWKTLKDYGLTHKCASIRSIDEPPDFRELLTGKEEKVFKKLETQGRKAVKEDEADVIVLGSTTLHQAHKYLAERLPVPVLNPGLIAYKICELLLELGLSHSKRAYPTPMGPKDEMITAMFAATAVASKSSG